jgi:hypothetical protein
MEDINGRKKGSDKDRREEWEIGNEKDRKEEIDKERMQEMSEREDVRKR